MHNQSRRWLTVVSLLALLSSTAGCYRMRPSQGGGQAQIATTRSVRPGDIALPTGYRIEALATGLTFPTSVIVDDHGIPHVVEAGYSYGEAWTTPRLLRVEPDGQTTVIASGGRNGPWSGGSFANGAFFVAEGGELEGGRIVRITPDGGVKAIVDDLPSFGDHHTNGAVAGPDGAIYFGQGTATNSGVIGADNFQFGWAKRHPTFHDTPCRDVTLSGQNFPADNPLKPGEQKTTGPFSAFGTATTKGQVIPGRVPCNGAILRVTPDGGQPELVAWGFRNPFGIAFSPDGGLYVTDNGYDDRGSRPVWGAGDLLWAVKAGVWHGWPDYVHSSSDGFDFSRDDRFGFKGEAFVAQFGDQAPITGKVVAPVGFKVVRVNVSNGVIEDFATNVGKTNGPASRLRTGGLERPVAARFDRTGAILYIVDFGVLAMSERGAAPQQGTGVLWRVTRRGGP